MSGNSSEDMTMAQTEYNFDADFEKFKEELPELIVDNADRFALYHDGERIGLFDSSFEAMDYGDREFGPGKFSIQRIVIEEAGLLSYSLAV